ncbi:MAG: hypothetical protein Q9219_006484 [cf. Caloplaca sp. 3 TL-2023]
MSPPTSTAPAAVCPIPIKAIRPLGTLHLTIGVMSLTEPEKVEAAIALLNELNVGCILGAVEQKQAQASKSASEQLGRSPAASQSDSNDPEPLTLSFTGLKSMHTPKSTSFLYTPPTDPTERLYPFCQVLKDRFTQEGLMIEEKRVLRLHATILNTIYAGKVYPRKSMSVHDGEAEADMLGPDAEIDEKHQDRARTDDDEPEEPDLAKKLESPGPIAKPSNHGGKKKGRRKKQVVKFDARDLLNRYAEFVWAGDVRVEKVAICEMGAKKIMDENQEVINEEYTEIASVQLPLV